MEKCKIISRLRYEDIIDASHEEEHRFHAVQFKKLEPYGLMQYLRSICSASAKSSKVSIPELFQFGLYTDQDANKAPRIIGFVGDFGLFFSYGLMLTT